MHLNVNVGWVVFMSSFLVYKSTSFAVKEAVRDISDANCSFNESMCLWQTSLQWKITNFSVVANIKDDRTFLLVENDIKDTFVGKAYSPKFSFVGSLKVRFEFYCIGNAILGLLFNSSETGDIIGEDDFVCEEDDLWDVETYSSEDDEGFEDVNGGWLQIILTGQVQYPSMIAVRNFEIYSDITTLEYSTTESRTESVTTEITSEYSQSNSLSTTEYNSTTTTSSSELTSESTTSTTLSSTSSSATSSTPSTLTNVDSTTTSTILNNSQSTSTAFNTTVFHTSTSSSNNMTWTNPFTYSLPSTPSSVITTNSTETVHSTHSTISSSTVSNFNPTESTITTSELVSISITPSTAQTSTLHKTTPMVTPVTCGPVVTNPEGNIMSGNVSQWQAILGSLFGIFLVCTILSSLVSFYTKCFGWKQKWNLASKMSSTGERSTNVIPLKVISVK